MNHVEHYNVSLGFGKPFSVDTPDIHVLPGVDTSVLLLDKAYTPIPDIFKQSKQYVWIICALYWPPLLMGSFFKYILYKYLIHLHINKKFNPLNMLTLLVAMSQHVTALLLGIWLLVMAFIHTDLETVRENGWVCSLMYFIEIAVYIDVVYSIAGRFGISVYRILYLRCDYWVRYTFGEKTLYYSVVVFGLAVTTLLLVLNVVYGSLKLSQEMCIIGPDFDIYQLLEDYAQSRGISSSHNLVWTIQRIAKSVGVCVILAELCIYINIFYYLYRHDNNERLRRLLEPATIKHRNQRNAIKCVGHFCSFGIQMSVIIMLCIYSKMEMKPKGLAFVRVVGFVVMSIVETLTSSTLRQRLFNMHY